MRPVCLSNNGSGMSLDTRKLILDFRDTVIIVTPGFPGHARHTRNSGALLAMLSRVRDLKPNTKLCIILWYKGFINIMELVFLPYLYKDTTKWNWVSNKISKDKLENNTWDAEVVWASLRPAWDTQWILDKPRIRDPETLLQENKTKHTYRNQLVKHRQQESGNSLKSLSISDNQILVKER